MANTKKAQPVKKAAELPETHVVFDYDGVSYGFDTIELIDPTVQMAEVMTRANDGDLTSVREMFGLLGIDIRPLRLSKVEGLFEAFNEALVEAQELDLGESAGSEG